MEKTIFEGFAQEIIGFEEERAQINGQIKDAYESFADEHGADKKVLRKAVKVYKDYIKDDAETVEFADLVNKIVYTFEEDEADTTEE